MSRGVALAQPQRRVVALEGDGSLLMQLGTLATIAMLKPKNLALVVMDNAAYQITGGQPTVTAVGTDLVTIARGAGIAQSAWAADEEMFDELATQALAKDGPWLIAARIDDPPSLRCLRQRIGFPAQHGLAGRRGFIETPAGCITRRAFKALALARLSLFRQPAQHGNEPVQRFFGFRLRRLDQHGAMHHQGEIHGHGMIALVDHRLGKIQSGDAAAF